jgi:hypothetical protein
MAKKHVKSGKRSLKKAKKLVPTRNLAVNAYLKFD